MRNEDVARFSRTNEDVFDIPEWKRQGSHVDTWTCCTGVTGSMAPRAQYTTKHKTPYNSPAENTLLIRSRASKRPSAHPYDRKYTIITLGSLNLARLTHSVQVENSFVAGGSPKQRPLSIPETFVTIGTTCAAAYRTRSCFQKFIEGGPAEVGPFSTVFYLFYIITAVWWKLIIWYLEHCC